MIIFRSKFGIGDFVFLKTDINQDKWLVVQVRFCPDGTAYYLANGSVNYLAYEVELSEEEDKGLKLNIS